MRETMSSRQRVINAIEHKPVDRFPIDLGAHFSTGINAFAYKNLRDYLNLESDVIETPDPCQFLARVDDDIMKRFHLDCVLLHPGYKYTHIWEPRYGYKFRIPRAIDPKPILGGGFVANSTLGGTLTMPENGYFFKGEGAFDLNEEDFDEYIGRYAVEARRLNLETDYFIMYMNFGAYYAGDVNFACDMLTDPEESMEKIKYCHEYNMNHIKKVIKHIGNNIQGICMGGDLGTQNAPLMNPKIYESMIHPYMKGFIKFVKNNSDYKVFMHSCGAVREFIPYFIDEGIDVLNPVQISAANMEPNRLKCDFGDKIAFWGGGCDTQRILNMKGVEEVKWNTKELVDIFKTNSGFIFNQVHNIMGDIKPQNIVAMLDTAYANSFY